MQSLIEWFSTPYFSALAYSLLSSLWQAAIIFLFTITIRLVAKNASARVKYNITVAGQLLIALWFIRTLYHNILSQLATSVNITAHDSAMLFYPGRLPMLSALYDSELPAAPLTFQMNNLIAAMLILYLLGILIMSFRLIYNYRQTNILRSKGLLKVPTAFLVHLQNTCSKLKIDKHVKLYYSYLVTSPIMLGVIKPMILLPLSISTHLSPEQIEAIITHELSHIKRKDYLVNLVQSILEVVFFFNPFIWLLSKIIREEREKACDEMVVSKECSYTYATALLALEKINNQHALSLAANGHQPFNLLNRIKLFTMKQRPLLSLRQKAFCVLLTLTCLGCIAWLSPKQPDKNNKQALNESFQTSVKNDLGKNKHINGTLVIDSFKISKESTTQSKTNNKISDTIPQALQKQIESITKDASDLSKIFTEDSNWKRQLEQLKLDTHELSINIPKDTALNIYSKDFQKKLKQIIKNSRLGVDSKTNIKDLQASAKAFADAYSNNPELKALIKNIQEKTVDITEKIKKDPNWQKYLNDVQLRMAAIQNNPEFQLKIKELTRRSTELANQILNDPKLKDLFNDLHTELNDLNMIEKGN